MREMQDVDPPFSLSFLPEQAEHLKTESDVNLSFPRYVLRCSRLQFKWNIILIGYTFICISVHHSTATTAFC